MYVEILILCEFLVCRPSIASSTTPMTNAIERLSKLLETVNLTRTIRATVYSTLALCAELDPATGKYVPKEATRHLDAFISRISEQEVVKYLAYAVDTNPELSRRRKAQAGMVGSVDAYRASLGLVMKYVSSLDQEYEAIREVYHLKEFIDNKIATGGSAPFTAEDLTEATAVVAELDYQCKVATHSVSSFKVDDLGME